MDAVENPYTPGAGTRPPALTGRDNEIKRFELLLARLSSGRHEKSMLITGLRGVGKTVLLNAFSEIAEEKGWFAASAEIKSSGNLASLVARLSRKALLEMSRSERIKDRARRGLAVLKAFVISVGDIDLKLDVDAWTGLADSGDFEEDLGDLLVEVGEVAKEADAGIVFLLDEVQLLSRTELEALMAGLHKVAQRNLPVAFVGVGLPLLPKLLGEAKSYAERLFDFRSLDSLSESDAAAALELPAEVREVSWEKKAVGAVYRHAKGYPYFLQEYGKHAWLAAEASPIEASDVETAHSTVVAELDKGFFHVRIERTPAAERQYMAAMADLGDGPQRSGEVAKKLGYPTVSGSSLFRDNLLKKGLIYSPRHGLVDFTVPMFGDYMRRCHPFDPAAVAKARRGKSRDFRQEVETLIAETFGAVASTSIAGDEFEEWFDYDITTITLSAGFAEEVVVAYSILESERTAKVDETFWDYFADEMNRVADPYLLVVSQQPVLFGVDGHLLPRIGSKTIHTSYLHPDEVGVYVVDASGDVDRNELRRLLEVVREAIVERAVVSGLSSS